MTFFLPTGNSLKQHMILRKISLLAAFACSVLFVNAEDGVRAELRMLSFSPDLGLGDAFAQDPASPDAASVPAPIKNYLNHEYSTVILAGRKVVFTKKADRASLTREGELIGEVSLPAGVTSSEG